MYLSQVGLGLPLLSDSEAVVFNDVTRDKNGPIACLGAGTGLGAVYLTWQGHVGGTGYYDALASEAGMAPLSAQVGAVGNHSDLSTALHLCIGVRDFA